MRWRFLYLFPVVLMLLSGCATHLGTKTSSPTKNGIGARVSPSLPWRDSANVTIHPVLGYTRLGFDGGHDNMYSLGGQLRRTFDRSELGHIWLGGEANYIRFESIFNDRSIFPKNSTANGFSIGPVAGYRFAKTSVMPVSVFGSVGLVRMGSIINNGNVLNSGTTGFYTRFGIELDITTFFSRASKDNQYRR